MLYAKDRACEFIFYASENLQDAKGFKPNGILRAEAIERARRFLVMASALPFTPSDEVNYSAATAALFELTK